MKQILFFLLALVFLFTGCKKSQTQNQSQLDQLAIQSYISSHNLNAIAESNGLYYVSDSAGSGGSPTANSTVTVYYKGYLTNGVVFDQTSGTPFTSSLSQVIQGWQEGIPLMQKGGKGILLIPSALAYGSRSIGSIPPNSVLIFDVTLVNFY
jgi:FKBP-type peptidyl-prolyl cis-trans isomerase FkpA